MRQCFEDCIVSAQRFVSLFAAGIGRRLLGCASTAYAGPFGMPCLLSLLTATWWMIQQLLPSRPKRATVLPPVPLRSCTSRSSIVHARMPSTSNWQCCLPSPSGF